MTATTLAELRARRDAVAGVDLVELRLDGVRDVDVGAALAGRRRPVVVTCRPTWEGGRFGGSEEERRRLLVQALELGAEYVDLEWRAGFGDLLAARRGRGVVLSVHDFGEIPDDLAARYRDMRASGAEVVKLAVMAHRLRDAARLFDLARSEPGGGHVLIAMGAAGLATRILASRLGCRWTYCGEGTAPGQIPADRMLREFRFERLAPDTAVYGVVGRPIGHSMSPLMHNAGFAALDLDAVYLPLEAADADDFVAFAERIGVRGASVTAPFKTALLERVDEADALTRRVGALNTVKIDHGRWLGANTDVEGFLAPLERRLRLAGVRAVVVGSGGAARAAVVALGSRGARVAVSARNRHRAEAVASLGDAAVQGFPPDPGSWDVLVNATPVGTAPDVDRSPVPGVALDGRLVYDLVYNPPHTRLLQEATRAGCEVIGGLEMLVAQAVRQFEWWTGVEPAAELFMAAAQSGLDRDRRELHAHEARS